MCLDDADFVEKAAEMIDFFINRHYPQNIIKQALDLVKLIPWQQILKPNHVTLSKKDWS